MLGNLAVLAVHHLPASSEILHPPFAFGPSAAVTAVVVAWARDNANAQIRLMMFLPVSGKLLYWMALGFAVLSPLFMDPSPEGVAAPFGGILGAHLLAGPRSPVRTAWLRLKLKFLQRKGNALTVESLTRGSDRPRGPKRSGKAPPSLRVIEGGLDDDKDRKPKDKRYLN